MSGSEASLTSHLTSLSTVRPYSAATEHAFLTQAGKGVVSKHALGLYLSQDRLYAAHGYVKFVGHILAKVPFSSSRPFDSPYEKFLQHVVGVVEYSLRNVIREFGLDVDGWKERKGTRDYLAEMARISVEGSFEDSLIFLWAMERVYNDAWKYVGSLITPDQASADPSATQGAVSFLVSNWTNSEFVEFVSDLESIVNNLDIQPGTEAWSRAEEIWSRVVELEEAFWPNVDDEAAEIALLRVTL
ncbi:heme oxygenase-like protein [Cristinia sonorae]|uniref:Heme oxygenase-like protein n=1 Tax=Cristinia sonorae TaxID=1940300 RepID=A0A8K0XRZ6_9AGAR|nr:heme oxygenase-like protein [Cristinia sonorae]